MAREVRAEVVVRGTHPTHHTILLPDIRRQVTATKAQDLIIRQGHIPRQTTTDRRQQLIPLIHTPARFRDQDLHRQPQASVQTATTGWATVAAGVWLMEERIRQDQAVAVAVELFHPQGAGMGLIGLRMRIGVSVAKRKDLSEMRARTTAVHMDPIEVDKGIVFRIVMAQPIQEAVVRVPIGQERRVLLPIRGMCLGHHQILRKAAAARGTIGAGAPATQAMGVEAGGLLHLVPIHPAGVGTIRIMIMERVRVAPHPQLQELPLHQQQAVPITHLEDAGIIAGLIGERVHASQVPRQVQVGQPVQLARVPLATIG